MAGRFGHWPNAQGKDVDPSRRRWAAGAVQDRASCYRGVLVATRLGIFAPGVGRLLHTGRWRRFVKVRENIGARLLAVFL